MNPPPSNPRFPQGAIGCFFCPLGKKKSPKATWGEMTLQPLKIPMNHPIRQNPPSGSLGFTAIFPKIRNFPQKESPPEKLLRGSWVIYSPLGAEKFPQFSLGDKNNPASPKHWGWGNGTSVPKVIARPWPRLRLVADVISVTPLRFA